MVSIYCNKQIIFQSFVDMKILYLQQDVGHDPRPSSAERVLDEINVLYNEKLMRGINSLTGLTYAGQGFLNDQA